MKMEKKMNDYENEETEIMTNEVAETATEGEDEWGWQQWRYQ